MNIVIITRQDKKDAIIRGGGGGGKALPLPKRKQIINFIIAFIHDLLIN
jgi:hypothetical protein